MILINQGKKKWWLQMLQINNINQIINANGNYYGWKKNLQTVWKQNTRIQKNNCKQVPPVVLTSKMLKKKSNKTYRSSTLITSDTESEPEHSHFN